MILMFTLAELDSLLIDWMEKSSFVLTMAEEHGVIMAAEQNNIIEKFVNDSCNIILMGPAGKLH